MFDFEKYKSLLSSNLDVCEDQNDPWNIGIYVVHFRANMDESYGRVILWIYPTLNKVKVVSTSTATNDFFGTAGAYTRAATFIRTSGLDFMEK